MTRTVGMGLLVWGLLALPAAEVGAGSITGRATYAGEVPNLRPLKMNADPECAAKHSEPVYPEVLVLGDGNTMANVIVMVRSGLPSKTYAPPQEPVVIDQRGCTYVPHVVGMMAGQQLMFRNTDGILHNVHALPEVNPQFNLGMPPTLKHSSKEIAKVEAPFEVKCDVHAWMRAYVAVLPHPFFAVTSTDGRFEITDLPPGTYEIEAWHERLGSQTATVTVGDAAATADFTFSRPTKK